MTDIFHKILSVISMFQFHFQYVSIIGFHLGKNRFISYTQVQFDDQVGRFIFHTNQKLSRSFSNKIQ